MADTPAFAWCSNIGISSIPFKEFLTTGYKQTIPNCAHTSHTEWNDIWGRRFAQPVRSLFVDGCPVSLLPPPEALCDTAIVLFVSCHVCVLFRWVTLGYNCTLARC